MTDQRPAREIGGVEQADARLPDERRGGEVVVLANPDDGRIGVESPQYGVADLPL